MANNDAVHVLEFSSKLRASAASVWAAISTLDGVNDELGPWVKMSTPAGIGAMGFEAAPVGQFLFASWVTFARVVPIDRHFLTLARIEPGRGFREESHSWTERRWVHERTITPIDATSATLTDHLELTPRFAVTTPLLIAVVRRVFTHRHRRLRRRFGSPGGDEPPTHR